MTGNSPVAQGSTSSAGPALDGYQWPEAVRFIPYWGDLYWEGVNGQRVLLLGESHYRREGLSDSLEVTRPFTQDHFREMGFYPEITDGCKRAENFWSCLATLRRILGLWNRSMYSNTSALAASSVG